MRLDHIAYRVADRNKTAKFFQEAFGYTVQTEFDLEFPDGSTTRCIALQPPEKVTERAPWSTHPIISTDTKDWSKWRKVDYHMAPEIFVSDGGEGSIVGEWVKHRDGIGGIHHLAYQVDDVNEVMKEWKDKGYAEFLSDEPLSCPTDNLVQVFTKPSELTGVIYEFINRGEFGFCRENVQGLMESTKDCK